MGDARPPKPFDITALKQAVGDSCVLLVKQHPMVREKPAVPAGCEDFAFEVSDALPIDELLVATDVLVTDYSSVVFEFSLFNRPMVFYAPDLDEYVDDRDFYYDYDEMTPGPVFRRSSDLVEYLASLGPEPDAGAVAEFRERFMSACDGHATDRILAWLERGER